MLPTAPAAAIAPQLVLSVRHAFGFALSTVMWLAIGAAFL